jgi:hypothetical protein
VGNQLIFKNLARESAFSLFPILLVVIIHSIHWMSAPLMVGVMQMDAHHHHQTIGGISGTMLWFKITVLTLNAIGMFFAVRTLWLSWKTKKSGWHALVCNGISIVSLIIGVWTTNNLGWY